MQRSNVSVKISLKKRRGFEMLNQNLLLLTDEDEDGWAWDYYLSTSTIGKAAAMAERIRDILPCE